MNLDACKLIISHFEKGKAPVLSRKNFHLFLTSSLNHAFNPLHSTVYQDMNQPLAHYFIESSHNTYLEGDQLKSKLIINK